jgi:hypothetical protein
MARTTLVRLKRATDDAAATTIQRLFRDRRTRLTIEEAPTIEIPAVEVLLMLMMLQLLRRILQLLTTPMRMVLMIRIL